MKPLTPDMKCPGCDKDIISRHHPNGFCSIGCEMDYKRDVRVHWLYCKPCGWHTDEPNTAMKPYCPICKTELTILSGTREEIEERFEEDNECRR